MRKECRSNFGIWVNSLAMVFLACQVGCNLVAKHLTHKTEEDPYAHGVYLPEFEPIGWIWPRGSERSGPVPYVPREGDIIFTSSINPKQTANYLLLGHVGLPHHVLVVIRRSSGELATFEVGAGGDQSVAIRPICIRLHKHKELYDGSVIAIRQIKRELTAEESFRLTCFAESQLGKPFAATGEFWPMMLPRRPMAKTCDNQNTWFCSELVVQALIESNLLIGVGRPRSLVPEDLYLDDRYQLSAQWTKPQDWTAGVTPTSDRPLFDPGRASLLQ